METWVNRLVFGGWFEILRWTGDGSGLATGIKPMAILCELNKT